MERVKLVIHTFEDDESDQECHLDIEIGIDFAKGRLERGHRKEV